MTVSEKARRALEELGLTGYEIKAYVTLVEFGSMTAAEVSRRCGVPYSKIYDVLGGLETKGWIEAEHSRPSKFYPKSPTTALETTRNRLETERALNEDTALKELTPLYDKMGTKERPEVWVVRGEFNILSKIKETLDACQKELMVAIPSILDDLGALFTPAAASLEEKGVRMKIMVSTGTSDNILRGLSRHADIRIRDQMFGGGVIADGRQVILLLGAEGGPAHHLAIWADHPGLTRFSRSYFDYLWNESTPYLKSVL